MERDLPSPRRKLLGSISRTSRRRYIIILSVLFITALLTMAIPEVSWGAYKGIFALWFLIYIGLLYLIVGSDILARIERLDPMWIIVGLFLFSLILYLPFLLNGPSMSQDIMRLERRGELLMDGRFPYRDFDVNKPPLYIWMVGLISLPFGPDQLVFRTFFVVTSSLVPVIMYLIHRSQTEKKEAPPEDPGGLIPTGFNWFSASIGYMLCPILLLEIGSAGHFDPIVVLLTVLSYYFLIKKRPLFSGITLGMGLALKLYPMFIAPLFFLSYPRWKDRIIFTIGLIAPTLLSAIPLLLVDPSLVYEYIGYQFYGWSTGISIRGAIEGGLDQVGLPLDIAYFLMMGSLLFAILFFTIKGFFSKIRRLDISWILVMMLSFSLIGVLLSAVYLSEYDGGPLDMALGWSGLGFSILFSGLGLYIFSRWGTSDHGSIGITDLKRVLTGHIDPKRVPFLIVCILIVLILTSAQFHTWYIIWTIPFLLASGNPYFIWSMLIIFSTFQINGYLPWDI
ncbi:MAG: glycosyltransferase 87 family protein [Candidatus Thermoplasmatota archaeon]|nr:glycosyltransferase 87 family protein [Candidatus Thermoplasmatota archaeon]